MAGSIGGMPSPVSTGETPLSRIAIEEARKRGWGSPGWHYYGDFLDWLQYQLSDGRLVGGKPNDVFEKENRQLAGMPGEEMAVKAKLANGQEWYRFEWSSANDAVGPRKAGFSFGLEAGAKDYTPNYAQPPHQDDLLALWDAMLASLKPR